MFWEKLSDSVSGPSPPSRYFHGFTSCEGILYLLGGMNGAGLC